MTRIESDPIHVARPVSAVYQFLHDLRNYKDLMPERVTEFSANENEAQLRIEGLGKFSMRKGFCNPDVSIELIPEGSLPFTFTMRWELQESESTARVMGIIDADLNMMLKMLAQGPLREFINTQAHRIKEIIEKQA